jgi:hypothetical protein
MRSCTCCRTGEAWAQRARRRSVLVGALVRWMEERTRGCGAGASRDGANVAGSLGMATSRTDRRARSTESEWRLTEVAHSVVLLVAQHSNHRPSRTKPSPPSVGGRNHRTRRSALPLEVQPPRHLVRPMPPHEVRPDGQEIAAAAVERRRGVERGLPAASRPSWATWRTVWMARTAMSPMPARCPTTCRRVVVAAVPRGTGRVPGTWTRSRGSQADTQRRCSRAATVSGKTSLSQRQPQHRLQLPQRLRRLVDLDRRHPHRPRCLQVRADVVEEHRLRRRHIEIAAHQLVDAWVGLA